MSRLRLEARAAALARLDAGRRPVNAGAAEASLEWCRLPLLTGSKLRSQSGPNHQSIRVKRAERYAVPSFLAADQP